MECTALHPVYKVQCIRIVPCGPGFQHIGRHFRFYVQWDDETTKPKPKETKVRLPPKPKIVEKPKNDDLQGSMFG